jgi:hypothetical protein
MSDLKPESVHVGSHEFHFIPPNQVHFVFRGVFDDVDAGAYLDFIFKYGDQCNGLLYSVYDISAFSRATDAGRKRVINVKRAYPYAAMALVGANFSTRAFAGMVLTAGRLVAPKHFNFPYKFVPTMDEANAWFDELRNKRG